MSLTVHVFGTPAPQGSKRHLGRGVMVESSQRVKPWRECVKFAALDALPDDWHPLAGPVTLTATFYWRRPRAHYRTGRNSAVLKPMAPSYPTGKHLGDVDKLARAILDALTDAGVWLDDSQVVHLTADKAWTDQQPGAHLHITTLGGPRT